MTFMPVDSCSSSFARPKEVQCQWSWRQHPVLLKAGARALALLLEIDYNSPIINLDQRKQIGLPNER